MSLIRKLTQYYSRRRFAVLFFSLLATMLASPMFSAMGYRTQFLELFLALTIVAATIVTLFSFGTHVPLTLLSLIFGTRAGYALLGYDRLLSTSQGISALICILSLCIMLRLLFTEGPVESERIFAALDVYLLIGVICGLLFCILEKQWPGSFYFHSKPLFENTSSIMPDMLYFSFVTLATLGYGDITPVAGPARALAVVETICGQIYLVVVVARLVSLYQRKTGQNEGNEADAAFRVDGRVSENSSSVAVITDDRAQPPNHRSPAGSSE
jgi:voltage-gated potassium channel